MPYDGTLWLSCIWSDFLVTNITAHYPDGSELEDVFTIDNGAIFQGNDVLHGRDILFTIYGDGTSDGEFSCLITCRTWAPTKSPTTDPTVEPTLNPSEDPTLDPTTDPTAEPTVSPTIDPTVSPTTSSPTDSPTTPAPTHPGEKTCGDVFDGSYSGEAVEFEVRIPHDGDIVIDCTDSDFEIESITAYDSDGNQLTDYDETETVAILDLLHGSDTTFIIEGAAYITSGTFDCSIECFSDAPSPSPTKMPTLWPTVSPTEDPTGSPTEDPTTDSPTTSPTADPTIPPGCCAGDSERTTTRCNVLDSETSCTRRASCHWIQTFDDTDCAWSYVEEPTDPGCCVAVDGSYEDSCMNFYEEEYCPTDYCYWTPTSDSFDCSKLWMPPPGCCKATGDSRRNARCDKMTSEDTCAAKSACEWIETDDPSECTDDDSEEDYDAGCCAGDSERASKRCNPKDSQTACDRMSSCHWILTDDSADCDWYGQMDAMETASGCCYATNVQSLAFRADLCQQYWNEDECMVSYDANGRNNCQWRPTDDDVDCDGLMTFVAAVSRQGYEPKTLSGADSAMINGAVNALNGEVSLMTVLMLFAAMFIMYRLYSCWKSARNDDGYEKVGDGPSNIYNACYQSTA